MRVKLGNPVSGVDFWPRPDIVDNLYKALVEDRGSRRMFGLRRIGKTSILLELERRLRADKEHVVIRVDVQGVNRFRDFLSKVFEQIPSDSKFREARQHIAANHFMKALLPAVIARIGGSSAPAQAPLAGFTNEFHHNAAWEGDIEKALCEVGTLVLIIDELPFMLRNMLRGDYQPADIERFLATLRNWRFNCGVRILLAGSLGLGQVARDMKVHIADHVGDLLPVAVPPLESEDAADMVDALANGEGLRDWSRALSHAVVEASAETWPIFLQYGFDAVWKSGVRDPARVKETINARVRQSLDETIYSQFSTRLARYGADEKFARATLRCVAGGLPEPATFDALDAVLDKFDALREDDFLVFDTESRTIRPASKLVPIWVRARSWGR
jgi:hypothetical protein